MPPELSLLTKYGLSGIIILVLLYVVQHLKKREEKITETHIEYIKKTNEEKTQLLERMINSTASNTASLEKLTEKMEERSKK